MERDQMERLLFNEFTPQELAILEFTNEPNIVEGLEHLSNRILTTKETYFWGVLVSTLITDYPMITIDGLKKALVLTIENNNKWITNNYESYYSSYSRNKAQYEKRLISDFLLVLKTEYDIDINIKYENKYEGIHLSTEKAFNSLVKRGYIEDPIFTGINGIAIAVLGFIPIGFTRKKKKGQETYKKINAAYWTYEKTTDGDEEEIKFEFKYLKALKEFKEFLVSYIDEKNKKSSEKEDE